MRYFYRLRYFVAIKIFALPLRAKYMMTPHTWIPIIIARLISLLQATSLRDRYYTALNRIEILETALDDIARISASRVDSSERHKLIVGIVTRTRDD